MATDLTYFPEPPTRNPDGSATVRDTRSLDAYGEPTEIKMPKAMADATFSPNGDPTMAYRGPTDERLTMSWRAGQKAQELWRNANSTRRGTGLAVGATTGLGTMAALYGVDALLGRLTGNPEGLTGWKTKLLLGALVGGGLGYRAAMSKQSAAFDPAHTRNILQMLISASKLPAYLRDGYVRGRGIMGGEGFSQAGKLLVEHDPYVPYLALGKRPNYQKSLAKLDELEAYYKANNALPPVPRPVQRVKRSAFDARRRLVDIIMGHPTLGPGERRLMSAAVYNVSDAAAEDLLLSIGRLSGAAAGAAIARFLMGRGFLPMAFGAMLGASIAGNFADAPRNAVGYRHISSYR